MPDFYPSSTAIQNWLTQRIATELKITPDRIDVNQPFASLRLDSVFVVTLAVDLETWLGTAIDPSIFWEMPDIASLSDWLVDEYLPTQTPS
ncbi:acyl carrier protein [Larkinella rosea]|uniref:Acyl carrier protein n=1 Tax=Larkinella rosea TaxID=2025312 RepID=A0A3P1B9T5_9BACT|nr:acyl carrier protein [Larkinella rosea]RRA97701.1 acyl carrier protein [Larkinella rosea]